MLYSSLLQTAVAKLSERTSACTIYLLLPMSLSLGENASSSMPLRLLDRQHFRSACGTIVQGKALNTTMYAIVIATTPSGLAPCSLKQQNKIKILKNLYIHDANQNIMRGVF